MDSFQHYIQEARKVRISWLSWAIWTVGALGSVYAFTEVGLVGFLVFPVAFGIGIPIPDAGVPHQWLIREIGRRHQWKQSRGRAMATPLNRDPEDEPCKIERTQAVNARVSVDDGSKRRSGFVPVFTTEERVAATLTLEYPGASENWLRADPLGKWDWELRWFELINNALGTTKIPDLQVALTRASRPPNMEPAFAYARRRGNPAILEAPLDDHETVAGMLADNLAERHDRVYGMANDTREFCFIRTPWPTRLGKRVGLDDADVFKRSALWKTASEVLAAYKASDVDASFLGPSGTQNMWDFFWRVYDSDLVHMREARDEAMRSTGKLSDDKPGKLDKGVSIRRSPAGEPGYVNYNGTYHIAGIVKENKWDSVRAGFKRKLIVPNDISYASTLYIEARRRAGESRKARERERAWTMMEGANPFEKGLSDPEGGKRLNETIERRRRIAQAGNRVARYYLLESVSAPSLSEAEDAWADYVAAKVRIGYDIERVTDPDDTEDILLTQLGVRMDPL